MPYCAALNSHICVALDRYRYSPCSRFGAKPTFSITQFTFDEYNNSHFVQQIKKDMEDGWAAGCGKCKAEEAAGKTSLRNTYNEFPHTPGEINFIEMSLSNECNLSCKMCNNVYSTKWQSIADKNPVQLVKWMSPRNNEHIRPKVGDIFNGVDLSKLIGIKYLGGEPFIGQEFMDLVEFLETKDVIGNITLLVNTNSTLFPLKLMPHLNKFKHVDLRMSIDGIGDLCNYIRNGKEWVSVLPVIQQWLAATAHNDKFTVSLQNTSQAYNLHQYGVLKKFAVEHGMTFRCVPIVSPHFLSYKVLPKEYVQTFINDLDPVIASMVNNVAFDPAAFEEFKQFTIAMDDVLKTSIADTIPELFKYF